MTIDKLKVEINKHSQHFGSVVGNVRFKSETGYPELEFYSDIKNLYEKKNRTLCEQYVHFFVKKDYDRYAVKWEKIFPAPLQKRGYAELKIRVENILLDVATRIHKTSGPLSSGFSGPQ